MFVKFFNVFEPVPTCFYALGYSWIHADAFGKFLLSKKLKKHVKIFAKFFNVFTKFFDAFFKLFKVFEVFGLARNCSDMFRMHSDTWT